MVEADHSIIMQKLQVQYHKASLKYPTISTPLLLPPQDVTLTN